MPSLGINLSIVANRYAPAESPAGPETLMTTRYVRLRASDTNATEDRLGMAEIVFYDETDSAITIVGSAVSQFAGASFVKERAYDGNLGTVWSSGGVRPTDPGGNWISFDFGEEKQVSRFECTWRNDLESPVDFVIETSADNVTFTPYATYPNINVWGFRERDWRVPRANDASPHYLYYRLNITANNADGLDRVSIEYLELRETADVSVQAAVNGSAAGSALPQTGYVETSSDFGINTGPRALLNDGQFWAASPTDGTGYLQFNFNQPTRIVQFSLRSRTNALGPAQAPRDFEMQGSNDRTTWTTLETYTAQTGWGEGETRVFSVV